MKTKVFIDFDGTLFNTSDFKVAMFGIFNKVGLTDDQILPAYQAECLDYKFSIKSFTERLHKIGKFNLALTNARVEKLFQSCPSFLYPDTIEFLEGINKDLYEVNLLTLGDLEFQGEKVMHSGIVKHFDNLFFTEKQKWESLDEYVKDGERFILIDDRSDTIYRVAKRFPKCLALEIIRRSSDNDDPMREQKDRGNIEVKNFKQAMMYL